MLTFAAAAFFLIITPGPGVLSLARVGSAFGRRAGTFYLVGLFLGSNFVSGAVVSGLAALLLADARIRLVLFLASFAYLTYLALRIAFAGSQIAFIERAKAPGIRGGVALQIINPKTYAVSTALFTGFSFWPENYTGEVALKFLILNTIWVPVHFLWLRVGISLNLAARTHRIINIAMAVSMMIVVVLAVATQLQA
jgi:threonine/homoserine/homoserine lactone efflux protein